MFNAPRGERAELRVQLREFNGARFVDVRVWTQGPDGNWYPTGKGTSLKLRELGRIITVLTDIARATGDDSRSNGGAR